MVARVLLRAGVVLVLAFGGCSAERGEASRVAAARDLGVVAHASEARIALPASADGSVTIAPPRGEIEVRFSLREASSVAPRTEDGARVYAGALAGADVMHVPLADGLEDLVFFDRAPEREELAYDLDVTKVAGLRQIAGTLELLDRGGAPRIRVERPWLVDGAGARVALDLRIEGCAVDRDPSAPWDRPVTAPGAASCLLRVAWRDAGVRYPAVVDPAWKLASSLRPRHSHRSITFANGRIAAMSGYVSTPGMGNGASETGDLYDPATGTWAATGVLPGGREEFAMALLPSGRALLIGDGGLKPEILTSAGLVTRGPEGPSFGRGNSATTLPSGKVLVAGGDPGAPSADAQLYDEATDTFAPAGTSPAGSMKAARAFHTATRLASGKVLLAGGGSASAEIYDPVANTFTLVPSAMIATRARHTASLLPDGKVLLAGGGSATAEIYDPQTNAFTATGVAAVDRTAAQAVVLASGDVMVAGGDDSGVPLASVEIFDAKTKAWSAQPLLSFARTHFAAARLAGGEVMVFGGLGGTGYSLASTEIWKPGAAGSGCTTGDDCLSGACEEGVCCATPCAPSCRTCAPGTGACVTVMKADDPSSCTGTNTCDASGACKKKNGQACAAQSDCASGLCVDGTCCDRACNGQCEACDVDGQRGTCVPVAGVPRGGRPSCVAPGTTCGGTCNGLEGTSCAYPSAVTTCGASCTGADLTASTCDGRGACVVDAPRGCAGNFVCADATSCKTSCANDGDCRQGYRCEGAQCLPIALCEERFVTKGTTKIDCYPYTCEQTGLCREACASVADCVAPTVCSFDGRCVDPPAPPEAGCSAASGRGGSGGGGAGAVVVVVLAGVAMVRRRRRA